MIELSDPESEFHLLRAGTLSEAIALIHSDYQSGWGEIIDCSEALGKPVEIQGQETLKKELEAFFAERKSGYFLVVGGEGSGKSAFVADAVRKDPTAVYHLIQSEENWDDPDAISKSVINQLRRKHGIDVQGETLYDVLNKVGRKLKGESRKKEVLLWVDGLDRIYGPEGRYPDRSLSDLLPVRLPEGVFVVLTSRYGGHLDMLADPEVCKRVPLGKETGEEKIGPRERAHRDVVDVLGLLAAGQEPLSLEDLTAFFGQAQGDQMKEVITLAQEFFSGGATADPQAPLQFYHTSFREFLLDEAKERREIFHRALAEAGEQWQELDGHAREYALRHLPAHQRRGGMWQKLADTLLDLKYVEARIERKGASPPLFDLLGDYHESLEGEESLPRGEPLRKQVVSLHRALDRELYILNQDSSLLGQQLYHALVWDWDVTTRLGREVRALARRINRPWLKPLRQPKKIKDSELLRILTGHDGKRMARGGVDGKLRVWDVEGGKEIKTLEGNRGEVTCVAITPDGNQVVSVGDDGMVQVRNAESGEELRTFKGCRARSKLGVFHTDISTYDLQVLLDLANGGGRILPNFECHIGEITSLTITPNGKLVVSGGEDLTVRVWDTESGKMQAWMHCMATVVSVLFQPGRRLLAMDAGKTIYFLKIVNG